VGLRDLWQKRREWLGALIFVGVIIVCVAWSLLLNPQHVPLFLAVAIGALGFVAVMALLPKLRRRFIERVVAYHVKDEERRGWLYRYRKVAIAVIVVMALIFPIATRLLPSQYVPLYVIAFLLINLTSGAILIAGMLKTMGKWVLLLMAIGSVIAILRILTWSR